jgi:hypothetical protein
MKNNMFSILLLVEICSIGTQLGASDEGINKYTFNDFDRDIFTNHVTREVEFVYSTPLVESVPDNTVTLEKHQLDMLVHPALTRIAYKQHQLSLRHCNDHSWLAQTTEQKEQVRKYWEEQNKHSVFLQKAHTRAKILEALLPKNDRPGIDISANDFMFLVQYAAQYIEHYSAQSAIVVDNNGKFKCFLYGEAKKMLEKYRTYEQQKAIVSADK